MSPYLLPVLIAGLAATSTGASANPLFTVNDARTLATSQLARELLGERLGSRVMDAVRHEYDSETITPKSVDFYTRPEWPHPRINGICRTDVITIEYDWFDQDEVTPSTPLKINHVEAASRYKAFTEPAGEPGSPENDKAQEAACASFKTALDAFRAPDAGDAQWLAAMHREYSQASTRRRFKFECDDFADKSCAKAAAVLPSLALNLATLVAGIDCSKPEKGDQVNYCYRLTFPYFGTVDPEWIMSVVGGMRDGMAPVEIRTLKLEHQEKAFAIP